MIQGEYLAQDEVCEGQVAKVEHDMDKGLPPAAECCRDICICIQTKPLHTRW